MAVDLVKEDVPKFVKRIGDHVVQGSNNTIMIMGTDRASAGPASVDDGLGDDSGAATIHLIAGRKSSDPDLSSDSAFIYISQKTSVDQNLGLSSVEGDDGQGPAVIGKSDSVRMVFRKSAKVAADGGSAYLYVDKSRMVSEAASIKLGKGASHPLILTNIYRPAEDVWFAQIVAQVSALIVQIAAAGAALTAAAGLLPIPIAGAMASAVPIGTAGAALTSTSSITSLITQALSTFQSQEVQYLSKKVTTE